MITASPGQHQGRRIEERKQQKSFRDPTIGMIDLKEPLATGEVIKTEEAAVVGTELETEAPQMETTVTGLQKEQVKDSDLAAALETNLDILMTEITPEVVLEQELLSETVPVMLLIIIPQTRRQTEEVGHI